MPATIADSEIVAAMARPAGLGRTMVTSRLFRLRLPVNELMQAA